MPKNDVSVMPRTGLTVDADENQMIALSVDAAKKMLVNGNAPTSIILHYLKQGTTRERLEREMMEVQKELLKAKKEAIDAQRISEELYAEAINLMRTYAGHDGEGSDVGEY